MQIKRGLLHDDNGDRIAFERSPNHGGSLTPRFLIMHYTAGASAESSIRHLTTSGVGASAHVVIGRDGTVTQLVPFNKVAWHAGPSRWQGLTGLNQHSIGIELDNAGPLEGGPGAWRSWFKRAYPDHEVVVAAHKHDGIERGWHDYTEIQLAAALDVSQALFEHYRLVDILGHDDIAPERKQDPGPAFPMAHFRARMVGRAGDAFQEFVTTAELNIREGPGTQFAKLEGSPLKTGTRLTLEVRDASWCFVEVLDKNGNPTMTGWVHGNFIAPVSDESE
ncbi:MAG: N-acetylmuramoyl-L-alanine amidase [Kiloniellales bacterium]|nr:N-acetylmuramoyl-L-alanine amidase [Kiloniellales bacterium]